MNELIKIPFNVRSRGTLNVGMQIEHNSRCIEFKGWETSATPYFKIDAPVNLMLPLDDNYSLIVTHELTEEPYITTGQLMGVKSDGTYVNETPLFPVKCMESIGEKPLVEYTTPERDLIYAQAKEAYERYQKYFEQFKMDVESGKFKGEKGDSFTYDDTALKADVAKKANAAEVYSKREADAKFLTEHQDVSQFVTKAVADLANYYTKSNTYTKTEVNNLISAIPKFDIKVVTELPKTSISLHTIYLVQGDTSKTGNLYTEYIRVNNKWEILGSQALDLSEYKKVFTFGTEYNKPSEISAKLAAGYICIATDIVVLDNTFHIATFNNVYRKMYTNIITVCCETTYWVDDELYLIGFYGNTNDDKWSFKHFKIQKNVDITKVDIKGTHIKIDDEHFGTDNVADYISWLNDSLESEIAFSVKITKEEYDEFNFDEEDDVIQKLMFLVYTDDTYTEMVGIFVNGKQLYPSAQGVDVQINGTSVLNEDGVANIPIASSITPGLVRQASSNNVMIDTNGIISVREADANYFNLRKQPYSFNAYAVTPGVFDRMLKAGMTDGLGPKWSEGEQLAGRKRLGLGNYELIETIEITEETTSVTRNAEPNGTPYNFSALKIVAYSNNSGSKSRQGWCNINDGYIFINGDYFFARNVGIFEAYDERGFFVGKRMMGDTSVTSYHDYSNNNERYSGLSYHKEFKPITKFNWYNANLLIGVTIKIYGIRM